MEGTTNHPLPLTRLTLIPNPDFPPMQLHRNAMTIVLV
jgi:hypothetical protein